MRDLRVVNVCLLTLDAPYRGRCLVDQSPSVKVRGGHSIDVSLSTIEYKSLVSSCGSCLGGVWAWAIP